MAVSDEDIHEAQQRVRPYIRTTPVISTQSGEFGVDHDLTLKLECLQHSGSFKARGAINNVLGSDVPDSGIIAASGGNHGAAVAFAAARLGHAAEIFVPSISAQVKQDRIASYGAVMHVGGDVFADAQRACDERWEQTRALRIHPYDSEKTVAGQASCALELQEQCPEIDTVLVAVGGGGLAAGFAAAYREGTKIVTVEPSTSRCLTAALEAGHPVDVSVSGVAADSLGATSVGDVPWELLSVYVDEAVLVDNSAISAARLKAWQELRIVLEPGGAAALAALTSGIYKPAPGERVAVVLCGSNTDPSDLI